MSLCSVAVEYQVPMFDRTEAWPLVRTVFTVAMKTVQSFDSPKLVKKFFTFGRAMQVKIQWIADINDLFGFVEPTDYGILIHSCLTSGQNGEKIVKIVDKLG